MNLKNNLLPLIVVIALTGCSETDEPRSGENPQSGRYLLSGKVEKGPFVRGSSISVQPLNEKMTAIGTVFNGEIRDDAGSFDLGQIELASQFVRIATDGYYYNEVSGNLSTGQLHLIALADLSDRSTVNVNILTHLKSARIQNLMQGGKTFAEADKQAQKELLSQFGLQKYESTPAESMTITAGTDGSGVLIAISSLVLNRRSDAEITQYLSSLSQDLADDGSFSEENMKSIAIDRADFRNNLDFLVSNIKSRYDELNQSVQVPDLRFFYDWNGDGIAGNEVNDNPQITLSRESVEFDYNGGSAEITVTSNVVLSLEKPKDSDGYLDVTPDDSYIEDSFVSGFYKDNDPEGASMTVSSTYENGKLTISVPKSERHTKQERTVVLYDLMGEIRVSIPVSLEAKPRTPYETKPELGDQGRAIVSGSFAKLASALSWMYYVERGYTGMYQYYDVKCPMSVNDNFNSRAFRNAYQAVAQNNQVIKSLTSAGYSDAIPFFTLLNAIIYSEMVDKWGNIGIVELAKDEYAGPVQQSVSATLRYLETKLDEISSCFSDRKLNTNFNADDAFDMSKDVWRMAKANVYMALNEPSHAMSYLQEIVDSRRYSLLPGNEYEANSGTVLYITVPDEVMQGHTMSYYSYADVLLLLAECNIATGNAAKAMSLINQVAKANNISVCGDGIADIETLRKQLFIPRYFAFQKRNSLGGYASYQHLWPIPGDQLMVSTGWTQNPGY